MRRIRKAIGIGQLAALAREIMAIPERESGPVA
jgi:hypothetical protein